MEATTTSAPSAAVQISPKKNKTHSSPKKKGKESPRHTLYFHNSNREQNQGQSAEAKRPVLVAKRRTSNLSDSTERQPSDVTIKAQNSTPTKLEPQQRSHQHRVAESFQEFQRGQARDNWRLRNGHTTQTNNGPRPSRRDFDEEIDPDAHRKVLISGFPPYTRSQDLARVLSDFGPSEILRCRNRLAVVLFDTEEQAQKALKCSDELYLYGEFMQIYPFTNARHVDHLFKEYRKVITKDKGMDIIEPTQIDLSGDFSQQFENIQRAVRLSREEVAQITQLYVDLEAVLNTVWPGCRAIPFGSIPTGLGIKSSDADCFVEGVPQARGGSGAFVPRARAALAQRPDLFGQLVSIPRANTPIVKFLHRPTGRHCDVSAKTPLGSRNTRLIKHLLDADARLAPLGVCLKYWGKVHRLTGTGRLTNYALAMLLLFYLQQPHVALAPPVEALQRDARCAFEVDHWNAGFDASPQARPAAPADAASTAELLGGFFLFYAAFDFDALVVCPLTGRGVPRAAFASPAELPPALERYARNVARNLTGALRHDTALCVQDPFELSHNVASPVSARLAADIVLHVRHAAAAFEADRAAGSPAFLRALLLTRPKLERREREVVATRAFLLARVPGRIAGADWRARVRSVLLDDIFATMLRCPLERDEPDERPEEDERTAGCEREHYAGGVRAPVWRRKGDPRDRRRAPDALRRKHAKISADILGASAATPLRFRFELGFRDEPTRACYARLQLADGDRDSFRGFVRFFHSAMLDWFRVLLSPWLEPPADAPAPEVARLLAEVSLAADA